VAVRVWSVRFLSRVAFTIGTAAILSTSCDEAPVGFDIELVADPKLNTVDQVLSRTASIELVLDSPDGLYWPGEEQTTGDVRIVDVDGDEALELVATVPVPDSRFPRIRLERGGLPVLPLTVSLLGYDDEGALVATGVLDGVEFPSRLASLSIPFNLEPYELPPRVVDVVASPVVGCTPPSLTILFSRPVDPATVLAPGAITFEPGGYPASARIDAAGRIAVATPPSLVVDGTTIAFTLTLATSVATLDGVALDQSPAVPGEQPYFGRFEAPCAP